MPGLQLLQVALPASANWPAEHCVQVDAALWPVADEKVPAGHRTGAAPAGQYQPAGHGTALEVAPAAPGTAGAGQKAPAGQGVQPAAPCALENEPAGQAVQPPLSTVKEGPL